MFVTNFKLNKSRHDIVFIILKSGDKTFLLTFKLIN